ncbi:MAG TPA: chemotaxis protein CheW [Moraxellaceae bacterium]
MNANNFSSGTESLQGLLLFRSGRRCFALPDTVIQEIVVVGVVTPLPFTPPWVQGLANIGGRILPQASLAALLGEATAAAAGELLVVSTPRAQCALHVDEVLARIELAPEAIQAFMRGEDGDDYEGAYIAGEFQYDGKVVLLLDSARLGELFVARVLPEGEGGLLGQLESRDRQAVADDGLDCLVFACAGERYALPLAEVGEIVDGLLCTAVPGAPAAISGITTLRGEPLLLSRLATWLGLSSAGDEKVALVLQQQALRIGVLVDSVEGIARFPASALRRLSEAAGDVAGVLHDEQGQVLGLLEAARLLRPEREMQLAAFMPARRQQFAEKQRVLLPHLQVQLGKDNYGIPLDCVQRLVPWHPAENVQDEDGRLDGVVNIDGDILPVLAAERLHQSAHSRQPSVWVVLSGAQGRQWAVAVDAAQAIVPVPEDSLEKIGSGQGLVEAVANVEGQLLSIVSLQGLREAAA